MKAIWNNTVVAQSDDIVIVENNAYFPRESINSELLEHSDTTSYCSWKGTASYFTLMVDGQRNIDAVWYYSEPFEAASNIKDRIAFWKGVEVVAD